MQQRIGCINNTPATINENKASIRKTRAVPTIANGHGFLAIGINTGAAANARLRLIDARSQEEDEQYEKSTVFER